MKQIDRDALKNWDRYKEDIAHATPVDATMSHSDIIKHCTYLEQHPLEWIVFFFPSYAKYPFAEFHRKAISRILSHPEWYEVLSWSRELAKSTVVMFCILFLALTGKKKNILLISNSLDNAIRLLAPYRANLEANSRLIAYYGIQQSVGYWADSEFITRYGIAFRAIGAGQSPRGSRNDAIRPDTILVDDMDTDEDCLNADIIAKRWNWWEKAVYPTRSVSEPTLVLWCGNIIAKDCCVVRAAKIADHWDLVNIRDKEGHSTWPQKNTEADIDRALSKISTRAAQGEYFNNPISEGEVFRRMTYGKVPPLHKFKFLVEYGDPAPGENKSKNSSTKAVMLLGKLKGVLYVIRPFVDHALNAQFIDWYIQCDNYVAGKTNIYRYMENNKLQDPFFQQVFSPMVRKIRKQRKINLYIRGDEERKTDKFSRIETNLEPMNREGNLILNEEFRNDPHMKRTEQQFLLFTSKLKFPADAPDCVEGGNRILDKLQSGQECPVTLSRQMVRKNNKYRL